LLTLKNFGEEYTRVLEKEIRYVRYEMIDDKALLSEILSPKGDPLPVKIIVTMPEKAKEKENMLLIVNTLAKDEKPVGGLTLRINKKGKSVKLAGE
jgi:hypothetical protein